MISLKREDIAEYFRPLYEEYKDLFKPNCSISWIFDSALPGNYKQIENILKESREKFNYRHFISFFSYNLLVKKNLHDSNILNSRPICKLNVNYGSGYEALEVHLSKFKNIISSNCICTNCIICNANNVNEYIITEKYKSLDEFTYESVTTLCSDCEFLIKIGFYDTIYILHNIAIQKVI